MRVLMLADVFFPDTIGGAGRVAYHLSRQLSKRGHQVHVLTRSPNGDLPRRERMGANLIVHRFGLQAKEGLDPFLREIRSTSRATKRAHHETPFDLLCAHQGLVAFGPLVSGAVGQVPFVYFFHSLWHEEYLIKKRDARGKAPWFARAVALLMRAVEKRVVSRAAKVFVLSRYSARRISAIHRLSSQTVVRIPGGFEPDRFCLPVSAKGAAKEALGIDHDKTALLTVRNLVPRMGLENLLEAFKQSRALREKALLLVGGEGFLKASLQGTVKECGLETAVRFLGRVSEEDLPRYYQASDFFVLPTKELEGFGLVILEAMACGTPVLATPIGAIPETVGLFDRRLLFRSSRSRDIQTKLEDVIQRPDAYRFDPQACRKFVEERFSWEKMADAFEREVMILV